MTAVDLRFLAIVFVLAKSTLMCRFFNLALTTYFTNFEEFSCSLSLTYTHIELPSKVSIAIEFHIMDACFIAAGKQFKQKLPQLTQNQQVGGTLVQFV